MNAFKANVLAARTLLVILAATALAQERKDDVVIRTSAPKIQPHAVDNPETATGADVTIGSGVTLTIGTGVTISLGGNFANNGTVTAQTGSTVEFNGTGDQTLSGTNVAFSNLTKSAGGTLTLNTPVTINNTLALNGGTINNCTNNFVKGAGFALSLGGGSLQCQQPSGGSPPNVTFTNSQPYTPTIFELPATVASVTISGSGGISINQDRNISGALSFTAGSGRVTITANLTAGSVTGYDQTKYVVTNTGGRFTITNVSALLSAAPVVFPVGTEGSYNPVTISNTGTPDAFSVSVKAGFDNPPSDTNKTVKRQWTITEATQGGSNATLTFQWNSTDQGGQFNTGNPIVVGRHNGTKWVEQPASFTPSPLTATISGVTSFSPFAVGNTNSLRTVALANLKVLLEGPFNTGTNQMNNTLRASILPAQFPGKPIPGAAVDSIQIEIRGATTGVLSPLTARTTQIQVADVQHEKVVQSDDASGLSQTDESRVTLQPMKILSADGIDRVNDGPTSPSVANPKTSQPAWLLADGTIRNFTDTTKNYVEFDTTGGNWYVVIRHRNHLAIMSAGAQSLSSTTPVPAYDFTTAQTQAFGTEPMKLVGTNKYALWAGDVNGDGTLKYNLSNNDRGLILVRIGGTNINNTVAGYFAEDVNLDGIVKYNLSNNDRAYILVNIGGTNINATRTTQVP